MDSARLLRENGCVSTMKSFREIEEQGTRTQVVIAMLQSLPGEKVVEEPYAKKRLDHRACGLYAITSQFIVHERRHKVKMGLMSIVSTARRQ